MLFIASLYSVQRVIISLVGEGGKNCGLNPAGALHVNGRKRSWGIDPRGLTCLIKSLDFASPVWLSY